MNIANRTFPTLSRCIFILTSLVHLSGLLYADDGFEYDSLQPISFYDEGECGNCEPCCDVLSSCSQVYLGHTEGRWLDYDQGYTTIGLFSNLPFFRNTQFLTFVDLRGHFFNDGKKAANIGAGVRYLTNNNRVFGINAFYDYREAYWNKNFNQVGVGLEMLSDSWDVRLNGYFPLGKKFGHSHAHHFRYPGGFFATVREKREAMAGGDVEIGKWIRRKGPCDFFDLYAAFGTYFYFPKEHKDVYGGEIRLLSNLGRYVTLEAKGGYDNVFHGVGLGRIILSLPLDLLFGSKKCGCEDFCCTTITCQPVYRQEIIALSNKKCCWDWNWGSNSSCSCSD